MAFVYILKSLRNNRYYVGSTNSLKRRIAEHESGKSKYTSEILPIKLVFSQRFENTIIARKVENWLKKQKDANLLKRIIREGMIIKKFTLEP